MATLELRQLFIEHCELMLRTGRAVMRLTLRTLLAYRDAVLRPEDSQDLHRRIQKSEPAGNVLRRLEAVARQSYATSTIVGKGLGGDPNAYAEYLDDVLSKEKIPEFERLCLESDERLSELAVCHALLCSALRNAVDVPNSLRTTALNIGDPEQRQAISKGLSFRRQRGRGRIVRADAGHPTTRGDHAARTHVKTGQEQPAIPSNGLEQPQKVQVQAPMVASGGGTIKTQGLDLEDNTLSTEVPSYLVGKTPRNWQVPAAIGLLTLLLVLLVWQTAGPWQDVKRLFVSDASMEGVQADDESPLNLEVGQEGGGRVDDGMPGVDDLQETNSDTDAPAEAADDQTAAAPTPSSSPVELEAEDRSSPDGTSQADFNALDAEEATDRTTELGSTDISGEPLADSEQASATGAGTESQPTEDNTKTTWLSRGEQPDGVILFQRTPAGDLQLLQPGDALDSQSELIVPPYYRTTLRLPGGARWTTGGPSLLKLGEGDEHHQTSFCRGLVQGTDAQSLKLDTPAGRCQIVFQGPASTAAVEVGTRPKIRGSIVDRDAYKPTTILVAFEGNLKVLHDGSPFELILGEGVALISGAKPRKFDLRNIPAWYGSSFMRPIDRIAAQDFARLLQSVSPANSAVSENRPVSEQLASLTAARKPYVAGLAVQASIMAGNWEPFVDTLLSNPRLNGYWQPTLDLARQLIAIRPSDVEQLQALFSARAPDGPTLLRMLLGFSTSELEEEGLALLVSQLSDSDLAGRILAWYQLKRITGRTLGYLPQDPNRTSIQAWRRELTTNRLEVLPVEDMIIERVAP